MKYSYHNGHCRQCGTFVYKGPDTSRMLWFAADNKGPEGLDITCIPCYEVRTANRKKAAKKTAYIKRQPTLFD